jgi:hypothetical protein
MQTETRKRYLLFWMHHIPGLSTAFILWPCCSHLHQVLSGQRPYFDIRSDHQVVVAILRGVKPKRPAMPTIADRHWDVVTQCWLEISQRPQISDVRDLMDRYKDAVC